MLMVMMCVEVVNGQRTKLIVKILNQSGGNVTLVDIAGSFHDADTGKTVRNVSLLVVASCMCY